MLTSSVSLLVLILVCDISDAASCNTKWYGPNSGYFYRYHTDEKKFPDAQKACSNDQGGSLVSIHSQTEWELVQRRVCGDSEVWIGMIIKKKLDESSAKWLDQSPVDFKPTQFKVNTGDQGDNLGVRMKKSGSSWEWNDLEPSKKKRYMCKRGGPATPPTVACGAGWVGPYSGYEYRYHTSTKQFDGAQKVCSNDGGNLASIHSDAEWTLVQGLVCDGATDVWLGMILGKRKDKSSAKWVDKSLVKYKPTRFKVDYSGGESRIGFRMKKDGGSWELNDKAGSTRLKYICKRAAATTSTTTPTTTTSTTTETTTTTASSSTTTTSTAAPPPGTTTTTAASAPGTTTTVAPAPGTTSSTAAPPPGTTTTTAAPAPGTTTTVAPASGTTSSTAAPPPGTITTTAAPPPLTTTTTTTAAMPAPTTTTTAAQTTTTTTSTTTTTPKSIMFRKDLHAGYTRSPTPCQAEEWAYSNQTGYCYMFFRDQITHSQAAEVCKRKNAELLSIENQDEQNFIDTVLNYDFYDHWTLGIQDKSGNFTYNGKEITYDNWLADSFLTTPKAGEDVCMALVKNLYLDGFFLLKWKWDRKPCSEKKSFVCQHIAKRCPALPSVDFVAPHPPKPFIELTINYTCQPGYKMPNYTLRYLEWKSKKPKSDATKEATDAWQTSRPNITTMPSMKYECLFPGKWSEGSLAPCEPTSCKYPPEVKYAERNSSDHVFPAWIEYKCEHGYHFEETNSSTAVAWCGPDQEWIDVPPDCRPVECGKFPRVGNATVNSAKNHYKETVIWTCHHGFMFPDRSVSQWVGCRENYVNWQIGRWNLSKLPDCITLECRDPPTPANTTRNSNATAFKSVIAYRCVSDEFEFPSGDEEFLTECSTGAKWKPTVPQCRKKPPKLKMKGKKYVPPPVESPEAKTVGTLAVIIMIVLLVLTILIDLGTCYQGFRFLRHNVRSFSRYYGFE